MKLQLSTDLDIDQVKKALRSVQKSGKVVVHWTRSQAIGPIGRPEVVKKKILDYMDTQDYARSAKQIGTAIETTQTSLYRILYTLVGDGKLEVIDDDKWKVKRFGDAKQIAKTRERFARAEAKAKLQLEALEQARAEGRAQSQAGSETGA